MSKALIIILILSIFIDNTLESNEKKENMNKIIDDSSEENAKEFNENVVKYLKNNFLYKNKVVVVGKRAFRRIFQEIMSLGGTKAFEPFKKLYNKICNEIIRGAYPKKVKEINATELDIIFEYSNLVDKFNKYLSKHKAKPEDLL